MIMADSKPAEEPTPQESATTWDPNGRRREAWGPKGKIADFTRYYRANLFPDDDEWTAMVDVMQTALPTTFRITAAGNSAYKLRDAFARRVETLPRVIDGQETPLPRPLEWYPDGLGWQCNVHRNLLRRAPELSAIHTWMKNANEAGFISRQEAVSMIPPLLLDVRAGQRVLDMCAAPGSKTAQLIERVAPSADPQSPGVVVANDADLRRCYLLTHQIKRLRSPHVVITNHEAQKFPHLAIQNADGERIPLVFDRVLCDVPCSGDGTLRKSPDIMRKWGTTHALSLHPLQIDIAKRGALFLAPGGRLVYSTCSLNPIENEACVAQILRECPDLALLDVSGELPALKRVPGIHTWKVYDNAKLYASMDEVPPRRQKRIRETMFPPTAEEAAAMHLERCVRVYPHLQDTGGFFIAAFTKRPDAAPLTLHPLRERPAASDDDATVPVAEAAEGKAEGKADEGKKAEGSAEEASSEAQPEGSEGKEVKKEKDAGRGGRGGRGRGRGRGQGPRGLRRRGRRGGSRGRGGRASHGGARSACLSFARR
eukprot:gnl/Trimastix_PCT/2267.p1 GENE.gnl/Trimastix_PCT/2267~~gnl/Trimastix_PCT/2267.p1  ORF type:complete len:541 (-),score=154.50 gnl/Trimastix_PCT/2267:145-1767(-)